MKYFVPMMLMMACAPSEDKFEAERRALQIAVAEQMYHQAQQHMQRQNIMLHNQKVLS